MNKAFRHNGNVFTRKDLVKLYIDELMTPNKSIFQRCCNTYERCAYMEGVQQAKSESVASSVLEFLCEISLSSHR